MIHDIFVLFSQSYNMASQSLTDSFDGPAKKRVKTSENELDSSSNVSSNPFELELKTTPSSKNHSGQYFA